MFRLRKTYLVVMLLLALSVFADGLFSAVAARTNADFALFMPALHYAQPTPGINGRVTENGSPAGGVPLDLRFYNGSEWSTKASTTTDANGVFSFTGSPSLGANQRYYVLFLNQDNPNRLYVWGSRDLTSYNGGAAIHIGDFDVANVEMLSPAPGATVGMPATFTWERRTATPNDSYEFNLYDYDDGAPYFYTAPPLGYVGSYVLGELPPGFSPGVPYVWNMWVYGDEGLESFGISYWLYYVAFSGGGLALTPVQTHTALPQSGSIEALLRK